MAGHSSLGGNAPAGDEVQKLREELAHLREYKTLAECKLQQMGLSLKVAQTQGWVSKRAHSRRKRAEKKKAADDATWAEINKTRQWIREERKKVGLPVDDPTPSPSEAAYRERVSRAAAQAKAHSLRNRVRRVSHQLLIAAALGKQYREVTVADHSGHNVPGTDPAVRLEHRPFDARSETSLSATEAMARSFRNWANREKQNRFRSRSHTPSTVYVSSRTTGPDTTVSGSVSDSSFADDDAAADVRAAMALVYDSGFWTEDCADDRDDDDEEDDDYSGGLASLSFNDVSDDIKQTACAMLAAAGNAEDGDKDWAYLIAETLAKSWHFHTPSSESQDLVNPSADVDESDASLNSSSTELSEKAKKLLEFFNLSPPKKKKILNEKSNKNVTTPGWFESNSKKGQPKSKKTSATTKAGQVKQPTKQTTKKKVPLVQQEQKPKNNEKLPPLVKSVPTKTSQLSAKSQRPRIEEVYEGQGNKPAHPHESVWNPNWWRVNNKDHDDGIWAGKEEKFKQPKSNLETGWITWDEQERRFPHLDERLRLHCVTKPGHAIYDPETVDTQVWDPLSRAIKESSTGKRQRLHLGPITMHSLRRWWETGHSYDIPLNPIQMPDPPSAEDKKRPLPTMTFSDSSAPKNAKKQNTTGGLFGDQGTDTVKGKNKVSFTPPSSSMLAGKTKTPTTGAVAKQATAVASVHYPLKSPTAQSFSRADLEYTSPAAFSAIAGLKTPRSWGTTAQNPLTPRSTSTSAGPPPAPTVALYESSDDDGIEGLVSEEEKEKFAAFLDVIRSSNNSNSGKGKRVAETEVSSLATKKRRVNDSEKENSEDEDDEEREFIPLTPASAKTAKSVRFDVENNSGSGLSSGMRDGARRALERYGRTSSRRGSLGPFSAR
ncbi:hypothetical protein F5B22DRAFT_184579 [Xylaria bambusicola]|uniref:uncharacterized protein n=1 Tax=Xylaria bambusicola TaxID=326684 RepID=UPI002007B396|nr:uncharacterized protein F5B22DRAFT_184579 [Xylaria bambusicola]KAI0515351.1 hypothetical protein F5B22DRAFT_184579 [Xylaria bambusicola]